MFFRVTLHKDVYLAPKFFGKNIRETLHRKLFEEVEGTCSSVFGWVITVTKIEEVGTPMVQEGTGSVLYPVAYNAIVLKPFRGEVLDAVVTKVQKIGIIASVGPLCIYISTSQIPSDMRYDEGLAPRWVSEDQKVSIRDDDVLRLKIVGFSTTSSGEFSAVGTILDDYLGPMM